MRVLNLLLLFIGATTALVYHPPSLLQHRGTHVLLSSEADDADADEPSPRNCPRRPRPPTEAASTASSSSRGRGPSPRWAFGHFFGRRCDRRGQDVVGWAIASSRTSKVFQPVADLADRVAGHALGETSSSR